MLGSPPKRSTDLIPCKCKHHLSALPVWPKTCPCKLSCLITEPQLQLYSSRRSNPFLLPLEPGSSGISYLRGSPLVQATASLSSTSRGGLRRSSSMLPGSALESQQPQESQNFKQPSPNQLLTRHPGDSGTSVANAQQLHSSLCIPANPWHSPKLLLQILPLVPLLILGETGCRQLSDSPAGWVLRSPAPRHRCQHSGRGLWTRRLSFSMGKG